MSTEEALDNAASYEFLIEQLAGRLDAEVATSNIDRPQGYRDPLLVRERIARVELWNRDVLRWLEAVVNSLSEPPPTRPFTTLSDDARARLATYVPSVTSLAGIRSLIEFYEQMDHALSVIVDVACVSRCAEPVWGVRPEGAVDASTVSLRRRRVVDMNLCPAWFAAAATDQIASLYALFIITRASGMTARITLGDAYSFVTLARDASAEITPAPTAQSAMEHLLRDEPEPAARGGGGRGH